MSRLILSMNLQNIAPTQYRSYPFTSFCVFQGVPIGAGATGIFRLDSQDTDNGEQINAHFETMKTDMGIENPKRLRFLYVGYRANDTLTMTVRTDDGSQRAFDLEAHEKDSHYGAKVPIGRNGLGRYWSVRIANTNGCDFSVDSISALPVILQRRLPRQPT